MGRMLLSFIGWFFSFKNFEQYIGDGDKQVSTFRMGFSKGRMPVVEHPTKLDWRRGEAADEKGREMGHPSETGWKMGTFRVEKWDMSVFPTFFKGVFLIKIEALNEFI